MSPKKESKNLQGKRKAPFWALASYAKIVVKRIPFFLVIFNKVTLPILLVLSVFFYMRWIPLIYLSGYIGILAVTYFISSFYEKDEVKEKQDAMTGTMFNKDTVFLILTNLLVIFMIYLSILRYHLERYEYPILWVAFVFLNVVFFEWKIGFFRNVLGKIFLYCSKSRTMNILLRTVSLALALWMMVWVSDRFFSDPKVSDNIKPLVSKSEVTWVLSTVDPDGISDTDSGSTNNPAVPANRTNEIIWQLSTDPNMSSGMRIDSIESLDPGAKATVKNGQITVQVVPTTDEKQATTSATTIPEWWLIVTNVDKSKATGWLYGVVMAPPNISPWSGTFGSYQTLTLSSDGASAIFFTIDWSDPDCKGNGVTSLRTGEKKITVKAVNCYAGNKLRWPIATFEYRLQ